jgi:glycosyltransferase involved in cell wall biosynthesis
MHLGRRGGGAQFAVEATLALSEIKTVEVGAVLCEDNPFVNRACSSLGCISLVGKFELNAYYAIRLRNAISAFARRFNPTRWLIAMAHPADILVYDILKNSGCRVDLVVHDGVPHLGDPYRWLRTLSLAEEFCSDRLIVLSAHVENLVRARWLQKPIVRLWHPPFRRDGLTIKKSHSVMDGSRNMRLLFFGRIQRYKGLSLLLDAAQQLRRGGFRFDLRIVGEGKVSDYDAKHISNLGADLENRFVDEDEVAEHFHWADLVVLPYVEASQSGVVATALAYNCPVLGTPVGGLAEQITVQNAGIVSDAVSAESLADCIRGLRLRKTRNRNEGSLGVDNEKVGWPVWAKAYVNAGFNHSVSEKRRFV